MNIKKQFKIRFTAPSINLVKMWLSVFHFLIKLNIYLNKKFEKDELNEFFIYYNIILIKKIFMYRI